MWLALVIVSWAISSLNLICSRWKSIKMFINLCRIQQLCHSTLFLIVQVDQVCVNCAGMCIYPTNGGLKLVSMQLT